jgi:hypothetical protein
MLMLAEPAASTVEDDVYPPLLRTTDPVAVPLDPETAMVTLRLCAVVMLLDPIDTPTVGVVGPVVPPPWLPPPHAAIDRAIGKRRRTRIGPPNRFMQEPLLTLSAMAGYPLDYIPERVPEEANSIFGFSQI